MTTLSGAKEIKCGRGKEEEELLGPGDLSGEVTGR